MSLRPRAKGRWLHGRADSEKKSVIFFLFFGWKKFHSIALSILMKLNSKDNKWEELKEKKKQQQQKTEISINKEPKLRINSEITVIIKYSRQRQNAVINFLTHLTKVY